MSKKTLIIIILVVAVLGAGGWAYYSLFMKQGTPLTPTNSVANSGNSSPTSFPTSDQNSSTQNTSSTASKNSAVDDSPSVVQINAGSQALVHITNEPVSGFTLVAGVATTSPTIRYVEQKSGHIFNVDLGNYIQNRISNTTLPNITEALFTAKGDQGIYRYLKENTETIESYFFKLSTSSLAAGYFLPEDIRSIAVSPSGAKIFYITENGSGAQGIVDNRDTNKKSTVFSSVFSDWTVGWPSDATVVLTTRPTSGSAGYLYFLNPATGSLKAILSGINGLTALVNSDASSVLFTDNTNSLSSYSVKTSKSTSLGLYTLPEKCVWSKRDKNIAYCGASMQSLFGNFPDDWYQGLFSFSDNLYKVNTSTGTTSLIADMNATYSQNLDIVNPALSANEKYFIFKNKTDGTLWSIKLP